MATAAKQDDESKQICAAHGRMLERRRTTSAQRTCASTTATQTESGGNDFCTTLGMELINHLLGTVVVLGGNLYRYPLRPSLCDIGRI